MKLIDIEIIMALSGSCGKTVRRSLDRVELTKIPGEYSVAEKEKTTH
jgi:hypothetical protein